MKINTDSGTIRTGLLLLFLLLCFIPVHHTTSNLYWGYDNDNYRDMSNVNNLLAGNLTEDPTYPGEYRWYNPLLHWIEAIAVKTTGVPTNQVLSQGGAFLNLLAPICFFLMMLSIFDFLVAISATAGFLFFTAGDLPGFFSATYTPWLYPVTFVQFGFYLGIIALYKAFSTMQTKWFVLLGFTAGFVFLGHTGPAVILLSQIAILSIIHIKKIATGTSPTTISKLLLSETAAGIAFILVSLPLTWFVFGKYHLKMTNAATYEYADPLFQLDHILLLVRENLSITFFVAGYGLWTLLKSKSNPLIKKIVSSWLLISIALYTYVTAAKFIRFHYGISMIGIVPSFHFFFYFKAAEAVLFGIGFVDLVQRAFEFLKNKKYFVAPFQKTSNSQLTIAVLIFLVGINYPSYLNRGDFHAAPEQINDDYHLDQIKVYQWLTQHTGINEVVLCQDDLICFPLLASGRKMVVCTIDHTNPYVPYFDRKKDRDTMLELVQGKGTKQNALFEKYHVRYILVENKNNYPNRYLYFPLQAFTSNTYSIFARATGQI